MAKTKIEWADKVWNPVTGCTKISKGCQNCYAERMHTRLEKIKNSGYRDGEPHFSVRLHPKRLNEPFKWKNPQRVFVCSMGDLFHEDIETAWVKAFLKIALSLPQHTFFVLTKRPERMKSILAMFPELLVPNLWLGVSIENQRAADERIPLLLQIPAAKRFVSVEPLLGPVILNGWMPSKGCVGGNWIDWVILGGETGPKARPMYPYWARSVRDQCQASGVPFFFKSFGEWIEVTSAEYREGDTLFGLEGFMRRVGKKAAGHLLDGKEYREWPE